MTPKNTEKHAFLIMAHRDDLVFRTLIQMLDHPLNDIFIHMDKKTKNYSPNEIEKLTKHSKIYHCKRSKVTWGGYSQINAELLLLKEATGKNKYAYYHLVSGQDLPIKTQTEIHEFFTKNRNKEFVRFQSPTFKFNNRIQYYYFFQEQIGKKGPLPIRILNKLSLNIQKLLKINRNKNEAFQKGTNWFSITDSLARYILNSEQWIRKTFKHSKCCDEIFLQTLIHNSEYKNSLYHKKYDNSPTAIVRLIDWERGTPYVYRFSDLNEIKNSNLLFARKFDEIIDKKIVQEIQKFYS